MIPMMIDECITIHWGELYSDIDQYPRSIDVLSPSATDEEILDYILEHDMGLITCDHRFSLIALWHNIPVIFHRHDGSRYYTKPSSKQLSFVGKFDDCLSQYALREDEIVVP